MIKRRGSSVDSGQIVDGQVRCMEPLGKTTWRTGEDCLKRLVGGGSTSRARVFMRLTW